MKPKQGVWKVFGKDVLRVCSIGIIIYGFFVTDGMKLETVMQQNIQALWMIKYILLGVFIELMRLGVKK